MVVCATLASMNSAQQRFTDPKSGFTIVELLIVIVVIAILAAITIVAYNGVTARAAYATSKQDMANIKTAIELYYAENDAYPDSANCANTPGEYSYQDNWCGWDQGQGDSFIPGLVPKYLNALPTLARSLPQKDTYLYQSARAGANSGGQRGTAQYQLIRFRATALGGLSSVETDGNSNVLVGGPGGYTGREAWGFRSDPDQVWW